MAEDLPEFSMKTVTHRLRQGFQAADPLCGLTAVPSGAVNDFCGVNISQVFSSCHASNVAGHRK